MRVTRPDLGNRELVRLQASWAAAAQASWAFTIVLAVYAYEEGGVRAVGVAALGAVIVRQGEPGDLYYVVEDGVADVEIDDVHVAERGAGESFGEIALVHDVPRTATVTARTSLTLLAMTRTEFLDAIGLHVRSLHAVHTQASERMRRAEVIAKV
jgi:CRP-like cAMP-binding protein